MVWTTVAELYRSQRRTPPDEESEEYAAAQQAIEAACQRIEDAAGQALAQSEDTVVLDGPGGTELILPRSHVSAVASVSLLEEPDDLVGGFGAGYTWSDAGILRRLGACWPCDQRSIQVTYTAGWDPVPMSLKAIAWRLVLTAEENPTGLESEKIGDWSGKWTSDVIAGSLTDDELDTISRYAVDR